MAHSKLNDPLPPRSLSKVCVASAISKSVKGGGRRGRRGRMDGIRHSKLLRIMIAGEILGLLRRSESHSNRERSERTTTEAAEEPPAPAPPARKNHWSEN